LRRRLGRLTLGLLGAGRLATALLGGLRLGLGLLAGTGLPVLLCGLGLLLFGPFRGLRLAVGALFGLLTALVGGLAAAPAAPAAAPAAPAAAPAAAQGGPLVLLVEVDRFDVLAFVLDDGGVLGRHLGLGDGLRRLEDHHGGLEGDRGDRWGLRLGRHVEGGDGG